MKKCLLVVILFTTIILRATASHLSGGEISYMFNGINYTVELELYYSCEGGAPATSYADINFSSVNQNFSRRFYMSSIDTFNPGCNKTSSCYNISSQFGGYVKAIYSDTVSLSNLYKWTIGFGTCCRSSSVNNIINGNIYIQTEKDSLLVNRYSPQNPIPLISYYSTGDTSYLPLIDVDLEGDSIVYQLAPTLEVANTFVTYRPGYAYNTPFGGSDLCYVDNLTKRLIMKASNSGYYSVGLKVLEYRSGVLLSTYNRDLVIAFYPTTIIPTIVNKTYPIAAGKGDFMTVTCPGKNNTIMLTFIDPVKTDSVFVDVVHPNLVGWTFSDIVSSNFGRADVMISWNTPSSLNPALLPQIPIKLKVRDNQCPNNLAEYTFWVFTQDCTADSVWPGDANSDNVVNLYDPLTVAIAYNNTGASRVNSNILWQPQTCSMWGNVFPVDNVDMKHADCNGNGTADNADLIAISNNYAKNHGVKKNPPVSLAETTNATLFFDTTGIIFEAGKILQIPIVLGAASSPIDGIYGIATSINADTLTLSSPVSVSPAGSWLSTGSSTMINFSKNNKPNYIDWAQARTTHTNISGYGTIGTLTLDIPATAADNTPLKIDFENTRIIDSIGRDITGFKVTGINTTIKNKLGLNNTNISIIQATIVPNPSGKSAKLIVRFNRDMAYRADITDITGRVVWTQSVDNTVEMLLPSEQILSGVYFVRITIRENESITIKWIKE